MNVHTHGSVAGLVLPTKPFGAEQRDIPEQLTSTDLAILNRFGHRTTYEPEEYLFRQGDPHRGIIFILEGRVRTSYVSPMGQEMTLAYWPGGHFVGAPQLLGGGTHMWNSQAERTTKGLRLPGEAAREIIRTHPELAIRLIEGLEYKSRCYAAMLQMVATQSKRSMLAKVLLILLVFRAQHHHVG